MDFSDWLNPQKIETTIRILVLLCVVLPAVWFAARVAGRVVQRKSSAHTALIVRRLITYAGTILVIVMILSDLGFKLGPLLSAAGIAGVAIGFAAQTTLSNFISGLFLLTEKPFSIGDVIEASGVTGIVLSIDLMSVKLRTFDNRFVRIPSASLIQNSFINATRFPIRRIDITVGVAYKEDIAKVDRLLKEVAEKNPLCLDQPAPLVIFQKYGDSALEFLFAVWCAREDLLGLRNSIMREVKERFDAEGIEIPFPHQSLYAGEATKPFPIRIVNDAPAQRASEAKESPPAEAAK